MNIGRMIISEQKVFESHQKKQRLRLVGAQGIKYVLEQIKKLDKTRFIYFLAPSKIAHAR